MGFNNAFPTAHSPIIWSPSLTASINSHLPKQKIYSPLGIFIAICLTWTQTQKGSVESFFFFEGGGAVFLLTINTPSWRNDWNDWLPLVKCIVAELPRHNNLTQSKTNAMVLALGNPKATWWPYPAVAYQHHQTYLTFWKISHWSEIYPTGGHFLKQKQNRQTEVITGWWWYDHSLTHRLSHDCPESRKHSSMFQIQALLFRINKCFVKMPDEWTQNINININKK